MSVIPRNADYYDGAKENRQRGTRAIRGKYVALGVDYWTAPQKLQKQVEFLEANPDYSLCFHASEHKYENKQGKNYTVVSRYLKKSFSMIELLFTDDFAPSRDFEPTVLQKGALIFGDLLEKISRADLSFLNLETPLCVSGEPSQKSGPNIRAHSECKRGVADAGFEFAGLANNHIMDFGAQGLYETLDACNQVGLKTCRAGKNLQKAQEPLLVTKQGVKIALIAVAEREFNIAEDDKPGTAPLDPVDNFSQIEKAKHTADLVVVTIHGGNEYFSFPRPGLRKICRFFIDRGADAVICHHAHMPGAYEFNRDKPIFYSLGNLIFDHPNPPAGWDRGVAIRLE
jgi:poly-gamma-glutamate capsule biosynthesis protein CapA/YwtB (metallophosphatase superfamily)